MNRLNHMSPLLTTGAILVVATAFVTDPVRAADGDAAKVARGKYLVTTAACNDCHTPWHLGPSGPEPDMSRMLSGHPESMVITQPAPLSSSGPWTLAATPTNTAWSGPWGVSFTANLTPDAETGLGKWTLTTFTQAIRTDLCLPAQHSAHQEPRGRAAAARRSPGGRTKVSRFPCALRVTHS
jgi:hypothetical protein